MLTPDEMTAAIAARKPQTGLEALGLCFPGMTPTRTHLAQSKRPGAMNDARTIASIPDQVNAWTKSFHAVFPQMVPAASDVFKNLWVGEYREKHLSIVESRAYAALTDAVFANAIKNDKIEFYPAHPLVAVYFEVFGRAPDSAGLAFWIKVYEENDWRISEIRAEFERVRDAA